MIQKGLGKLDSRKLGSRKLDSRKLGSRKLGSGESAPSLLRVTGDSIEKARLHQVADLLGIGLAPGGFHDLADEKAH